MTAIRFASRIDVDTISNVAITEVDDASLEKHFEECPEAKSVIGIPVYYCEKYGYWPVPAPGWTVHHQEYPV